MLHTSLSAAAATATVIAADRPPQVREVTSQYTHKEFRWKAEALLALQEMAEAYLTALFEDA